MALRFGSAWHRAMEATGPGADLPTVLAAAVAQDEFDELTLATLGGLLAAYLAVYRDAPVQVLHREVEFSMPMARSRTFYLAGKIDGLGRLEDGRLCLVEHKTTSSSVDPASDYWLRLRADGQILSYVAAARALGWDIATVLYDVVRKPAIRQRQNETAEQFGDRLAQDALDRPDFYYARREVPVLDQDLEEFEAMRLSVSRMILDRRRDALRFGTDSAHCAWPRHVNSILCPSCEYVGFCLANAIPDLSYPPAGFTIGRVNPELSQEQGQ